MLNNALILLLLGRISSTVTLCKTLVSFVQLEDRQWVAHLVRSKLLESNRSSVRIAPVLGSGSFQKILLHTYCISLEWHFHKRAPCTCQSNYSTSPVMKQAQQGLWMTEYCWSGIRSSPESTQCDAPLLSLCTVQSPKQKDRNRPNFFLPSNLSWQCHQNSLGVRECGSIGYSIHSIVWWFFQNNGWEVLSNYIQHSQNGVHG